ncbi:2-phosphosulfolactate phosphatase [Paenibacillus sp. yr247]|uniref:2-phosphosulfolactate phosphatase n=1 Tax=Paenibacillus sp. yr247 TaxID=1761880 RepID=UPI00087EDF03|nr:2-phosphosulfolactate phosphatase [Paenibacillus sp. yr247]SDO33054.1 2-phosphosulfolactate phosphatase [Paenibacillus sp. yr247]
MKEIRFEVAFMPKEVKPNSAAVCIVIDVIRASTTMVNLLEKGCPQIILTSDEKQFMNNNPDYWHDGTLICAEEYSGNVAEGAHFSPSLKSLEKMDVNRKRVVLRTTNGTVAVQTLHELGVKHILIGCMNNAQAVMEKALDMADELNTSIMVVCAGRDNTQIAALDDAYCAGILVKYGQNLAKARGIEPVFMDSAKIASHMLSVYSDTIDAFNHSGSGETMRRIQCPEDIITCAKENGSTIVPMVSFHQEKQFIIVTKAKELAVHA